MNEKRQRDLSVLGAMHGIAFEDDPNAPVDFDGGARAVSGFETGWTPATRARRRPVFHSAEDGWQEVEIEDGAELFFSGLGKKD